MITGTTENRLLEIRGYGTIPYQVGINGVTFINNEKVEYILDEINYVTFFDDDNTTIYTLPNINRNPLPDNVIVKDDLKPYDEAIPSTDRINIDRGEFSVFEQLYKLAKLNTLDDIQTFFPTI